MFEQILLLMIGCFTGTITGLIPGLHINTITFILLSILTEPNELLVFFIVGMAVVHSFVDFIPSIFLGIPDDESFLSLLSGHKLVLKGEGLYGVRLTVVGGIFASVIALIISPLFFVLVDFIKDYFQYLIPILLIFLLFVMVFENKSLDGKCWSAITIILAGVLGLRLLHNASLVNPLFPIITGLFATPPIIQSLKNKPQIINQKNQNHKFEIKQIINGAILSSIAGSIVAIFPAIGASQAAFTIQKTIKKITNNTYLIILGGINTVNMIFSFIVLYHLNKTRTGAAVAIKELAQIDFTFLIQILTGVLIAIGIGAIITDLLGQKITQHLHKINYTKLNIIILIFLFTIILIFNQLTGILILITATAIGLIPLLTNIKRTTCMACLMIPTISYYLSLF